MNNKIWSLILLITFCGVIVNAWPYRTCSQHDISTIKAKYVRSIWNEAEDLEDISEILSEGRDKINSKLRDLNEEVDAAIKFADGKGFDIYRCLDFNHINNISNTILNHYKEEIQNQAQGMILYVQTALNSIDTCTITHLSCKTIENCCKNVVRNFDNDVIEDGVEDLEDFSEKLVKNSVQDIKKEINKIRKNTTLCYLEHLQSTTEVPTTEPIVETTSENVAESTTADVPESTTENVPESTTGNVPESTSANVPEATTASVPESTTENVPESTSANVPESTTENVPESTTGNVPESTSANVPESTTENVPESTTGNVPETTTGI